MKDTETIKKLDKIIEIAISAKQEILKSALVELHDISEPEQNDTRVVKAAMKNDRAIKVINHLSDMRIRYKLSLSPLSVNKARIDLINKRLNESSVEEAIDVIDTRFHEYLNTENEHLLNLDSIFKTTRFFNYLDDVSRVKSLMIL